MSEQLAKLEKKGGGMSEKVLWTNSAPTSNFSSQTVTLSDDITTFDYIRAYYRVSKAIAKEASVLMSISDFLEITTENGECRFMMGTSNAGFNYFRMARRNTDTTLYFSPAYTSAGSGASDNSQVIPTKICGCKL